MCQIIPHQQSTSLYFSSHDTICQGAGRMHVIIHNHIINNLNKSVLGQVSLILKLDNLSTGCIPMKIMIQI